MKLKELKILDRVFQQYLDNNDNDEAARDLYLELISPVAHIIKRQ